jgi:hypothetical protein
LKKDEQGLGHDESCIGEEEAGVLVDVPDVIEKGKWMFNLRNQSIHKESHISKCQSLLNQDIK